MYFFNICENPDILRVIYFGSKLLDLVFFIIPFLLIVMITIDLVKIVIGANDEKNIRTNRKTIINRLIYAMLLFFVPTIVSVVMNLLGDVNFNSGYQQCLNNANKISINHFQEIKDANEQFENNNYTNKNLSTGNTYQDLANKMVAIATNQIGTKEGSNNSNKYGTDLGINHQPWCGIFVTWVAQNTNIGNTNLYDDVITKNNNLTNFASSTDTLVDFYEFSNLKFEYSKHYGGNYTPKAGDYIFFDTKERNWNKTFNRSLSIEGMRISNHVGLVVSADSNNVYTIEGNTSDGVAKKTYKINSAKILGYGSWYNN